MLKRKPYMLCNQVRNLAVCSSLTANFISLKGNKPWEKNVSVIFVNNCDSLIHFETLD